jgi:hypothetical protein
LPIIINDLKDAIINHTVTNVEFEPKKITLTMKNGSKVELTAKNTRDDFDTELNCKVTRAVLEYKL